MCPSLTNNNAPQDKLSRLAKDEAAGVYKDVLEAAATGAKARPKLPPRPSLDAAAALAVDSDLDAASREVRKRAVRKVSVDLPGEHTPPQHLKKKYVENLSGQMKQCDDVLRELMTGQLKARCEPFLRIPPRSPAVADPIDLYKIQVGQSRYAVAVDKYKGLKPVLHSRPILEFLVAVKSSNSSRGELSVGFLQHASKVFQKYWRISPKILNNSPKIKFPFPSMLGPSLVNTEGPSLASILGKPGVLLIVQLC